jgi:hypothetical protein
MAISFMAAIQLFGVAQDQTRFSAQAQIAA